MYIHMPMSPARCRWGPFYINSARQIEKGGVQEKGVIVITRNI